MLRKYSIFTASALLTLTGLFRGAGGISLLVRGNRLDTGIPLTASPLEVRLVAAGLLAVCALLIYASVRLVFRRTAVSRDICLVSLLLFLADGVLNGYLLFGHPLATGQTINIAAALLISLFLFLGIPAMKKPKIAS